MINRVLRPYQIEFQNDEGFQVEFEVENANVLAAEEFTVDVTIKDELQTVVFFESVQGCNLEPYSTSISEQFDESLIKEFSLSQNYHNPFNPTTVIKNKIPTDSQARLRVYNSLGQLVRTLSSGFKKAGSYQITFRSDNLASGVYIYELSTDNFYDSKKMVLIR